MLLLDICGILGGVLLEAAVLTKLPFGPDALFFLTGTFKSAFCPLCVPTQPRPGLQTKQQGYKQQRQCISREQISYTTSIKG